MNAMSIVQDQYQELTDSVAKLGESVPLLGSIADRFVACLVGGGKILTAGNGGSAADALHLAEELVGRYRSNRRALPAVALVADTTAITCIGNDFGFEQIFSRQVEALGNPGDLLVVFSTSGNSANLIEAMKAAKRKRVDVLGFLGGNGGKLAGQVDLEWRAPSSNTARIQEMHTWAMHCLLEVTEAHFKESTSKRTEGQGK